MRNNKENRASFGIFWPLIERDVLFLPGGNWNGLVMSSRGEFFLLVGGGEEVNSLS